MYAQIVEQVVAKVMAGQWAAGHALPSIRELAAACKVSVITVKRAYLELEHAGVIVTRHGKGSFVAERLDATRALAAGQFEAQLKGLLEAGRKLGLEPQDIVGRIEQELAVPSPGDEE
jgi:GntR family transcriptional regulator